MEQSPTEILRVAFERAIANPRVVADDEAYARIASICQTLSNRACARFILATTLAKTILPNIDIRKPYTEIGDPDVYSGRTYDEAYITSFVIQHRLPCNATTAFLTPAFRNRNMTLTPDLSMVGRPEALYRATLQLLTDIESGRMSAFDVLVQTISLLLIVRDQNVPPPPSGRRRLFLSYARHDRARVTRLYDGLLEAKQIIWYDQHLLGGQKWWDEICMEIRLCDVFLLALSPKSLASAACRLELEYALCLHKPVVPVEITRIADYRTLNNVLRQTQIVGCSKITQKSIDNLLRALASLQPSPPLPNPLPKQPDVPISLLEKVSDALDATILGTEDEQRLLLSRIEDYLQSSDKRDARLAHKLLLKMQQHPDLLARLLKKIDDLLQQRRKDL